MALLSSVDPAFGPAWQPVGAFSDWRFHAAQEANMAIHAVNVAMCDRINGMMLDRRDRFVVRAMLAAVLRGFKR